MATGNGYFSGNNNMNPTRILKQLTPLLNLSAQARLEKIQSGEVNQVFRLHDGDNCYAVKSLADDDFSGINRLHQYILQEQLARRGLAPAPVWMSQDAALWVEQWCTVPADSQPRRAVCRATVLADVLATIHAQPISAHALDLPARLEHYLTKAQLSYNSALAVKIRQAIREFTLAKVPIEHLVLCHNDLSWGHVVSMQPPVLVDWEYAAMGNRFFDLAACMSINQLNANQQEILLSHYCQQTGLALNHAQPLLAQQQQVVALTEQVWGRALHHSQRSQQAG